MTDNVFAGDGIFAPDGGGEPAHDLLDIIEALGHGTGTAHFGQIKIDVVDRNIVGQDMGVGRVNPSTKCGAADHADGLPRYPLVMGLSPADLLQIEFDGQYAKPQQDHAAENYQSDRSSGELHKRHLLFGFS